MSSNERCKHFAPPQPTATQGTATVGPFVCPWCEIERLRRQAGEVAVLILQNDRDEVLEWARGVKLTFSDGAPELACEISTPETACDHAQADARGNAGDLEIYCSKCGQVLRAAVETFAGCPACAGAPNTAHVPPCSAAKASDG